MSIRIGFVDNKLENFHANVFLKAYRNQLKDRATIAGCFALDDVDGRAWAKKNEVPYFDSVEKLNQNVDAFMILAPSNPELHQKLAEVVFPFGKTTYVDKTFAPDLATAKRIFELADQRKTAIQTTSALRYTNVQEYVRDAKHGTTKHMVAWGGGSSFGEYAIHPVELVISCIGADATSLMRRGDDHFSQLLINFTGDRTAVANVYTQGETPYAASVTTEHQTTLLHVPLDQIFVNNAKAVLDLFETGKPNIDRRETLMIRRILDVAGDPAALHGFVKL